MTLNIEVAYKSPFKYHSQEEICNGVVPAVGDFIALGGVCFRVKYRYFDYKKREVIIRCVLDQGIFEYKGIKRKEPEFSEDEA